nr:hypothetical protein [Paramuribaculum sp.]
MSIFNHIKRAFGLGDNFDSEDYDLDDAEEYTPQYRKIETKTTPLPSGNDETLSGDIFDGVIELFNRTQPEFVRECINTDAQKDYILNNIDSGLKVRLEKEVNAAKARGQMLWEEEMKKLGKEVEILKQEKEDLEQKREESKSQRLSAERQKRALVERVHDLETQLLNMEAEKEQYILENRSMLNKLRVVSVTSGGASDEAFDEIERLGSELEAARSAKELALLDAEHYKAVAQAHIPVMEYLLTTIEELVAEISSSSAPSISTDKTAEYEAELKDAEKTISSLNKRIDALLSTQDRDVREISDLSALVKEKDATIDELRKMLDDSPVSL